MRPYWDVLRHRAPLDALDRVDAWRAAGRLEVLAGRVASCAPGPGALEVELDLVHAPCRRDRYNRIVRCVGPALERAEGDAPLVRALIASGLAAADPAGLGVVTDAEGRLIDPSGTPSTGSSASAPSAARRAGRRPPCPTSPSTRSR